MPRGTCSWPAGSSPRGTEDPGAAAAPPGANGIPRALEADGQRRAPARDRLRAAQGRQGAATRPPAPQQAAAGGPARRAAGIHPLDRAVRLDARPRAAELALEDPRAAGAAPALPGG